MQTCWWIWATNRAKQGLATVCLDTWPGNEPCFGRCSCAPVSFQHEHAVYHSASCSQFEPSCHESLSMLLYGVDFSGVLLYLGVQMSNSKRSHQAMSALRHLIPGSSLWWFGFAVLRSSRQQMDNTDLQGWGDLWSWGFYNCSDREGQLHHSCKRWCLGVHRQSGRCEHHWQLLFCRNWMPTGNSDWTIDIILDIREVCIATQCSNLWASVALLKRGLRRFSKLSIKLSPFASETESKPFDSGWKSPCIQCQFDHLNICTAYLLNWQFLQLVDEAFQRWLVEEEGVVDDITAVVVKFSHEAIPG